MTDYLDDVAGRTPDRIAFIDARHGIELKRQVDQLHARAAQARRRRLVPAANCP